MRIGVTGFVSAQAGSIASANALLLKGLLERGVEVDFFSKPSFVDPRPIVGKDKGFRFVEVVNHGSDALRRSVSRAPLLRTLASRNDSACYNRLLVRTLQAEHTRRRYDVLLWMGDYAHGSVPGVPTISFAQGASGSDARSLLRRGEEVNRLAGSLQALKWQALARLRLSSWGLPRFECSDHIIVGSTQSKEMLHLHHGVPLKKISGMPYPIDLDLFDLPQRAVSESGRLRVLWLGRIVPRKRLDLFLDGTAEAIRKGVDVNATVVGSVGLVRGYEKLIASFPFPERLTWIPGVARPQVPTLLASHDVLAQPSEEEDFGSSVAEAQACGLPVIVGATNGNADYLCSRDIHLADDRVSTFANALLQMELKKRTGHLGTPEESRIEAERNFVLSVVTEHLLEILRSVAGKPETRELQTI